MNMPLSMIKTIMLLMKNMFSVELQEILDQEKYDKEKLETLKTQN